jgi:chromosome segregation ATPase
VATKTIEKRVSDLEEIIDDIPRLINVRFSFVRAQLDALDARIGTVEAKVDRLEARIGGVEAKVDSIRTEVQALPRVLAEMLDERDRRRS